MIMQRTKENFEQAVSLVTAHPNSKLKNSPKWKLFTLDNHSHYFTRIRHRLCKNVSRKQKTTSKKSKENYKSSFGLGHSSPQRQAKIQSKRDNSLYTIGVSSPLWELIRTGCR